jgi:AP2 domain
MRRELRHDNSTGFVGVGFHKDTRKFMARISKDGKRFYIGIYPTALEAHQAYLKAKEDLYERGKTPVETRLGQGA